MLSYFRPWFDAWVESASGKDGFWRTERPRDHFRTASSSSSRLADVLVELLDEHQEIHHVVELGAGDGRLLSALSPSRPRLSLTGVDLVPRPEQLAGRVGWCRDLWDVVAGRWSVGPAHDLLSAIDGPALVLAVEWFDDLPGPVATRQSSGWHVVEVDPSGAERTGDRVDESDRVWLEEWWPAGGRAEVGRTRDSAWGSVLSQLSRHGGLALAIDYGHLRAARPPTGSLQAFRDGRQVDPAPDSDRNLTAAVAMDALAATGVRVGASTLFCARQRDVLSAGASSSERDPLTALVDRSERAALVNPGVWGDQWWLLQQVPARGR